MQDFVEQISLYQLVYYFHIFSQFFVIKLFHEQNLSKNYGYFERKQPSRRNITSIVTTTVQNLRIRLSFYVLPNKLTNFKN